MTKSRTKRITLRCKTELQEQREARDMAIYREYHDTIAANPEQSRTQLRDYLMKKYNIRATSAIYTILKRAEARLQLRAETAGA